MTAKEYKDLTMSEFTKAAEIYESDNAGVYNMCKKDYPDVLAELEKEPFNDLLDCGCGTGPMLTLLHEKYPEKHYTGIDLTPKMIEVAPRAAAFDKRIKRVVGWSIFPDFFDVIICDHPKPMRCYTPAEITAALKAAGFTSVKSDHHPSKPWITVIAKK